MIPREGEGDMVRCLVRGGWCSFYLCVELLFVFLFYLFPLCSCLLVLLTKLSLAILDWIGLIVVVRYMYVCLGALVFLSFLSCYVLLFSSLLFSSLLFFICFLYFYCLSYITMSQYETQKVFTNKIPSYPFNCCIKWPAGYCISCRIAHIIIEWLDYHW